MTNGQIKPATKKCITAWIVIFGAMIAFAFYQGLFGVGIQPSSLGAAYFIPTVLVPLLLSTHAMLFVLLLRAPQQ